MLHSKKCFGELSSEGFDCLLKEFLILLHLLHLLTLLIDLQARFLLLNAKLNRTPLAVLTDMTSRYRPIESGILIPPARLLSILIERESSR